MGGAPRISSSRQLCEMMTRTLGEIEKRLPKLCTPFHPSRLDMRCRPGLSRRGSSSICRVRQHESAMKLEQCPKSVLNVQLSCCENTVDTSFVLVRSFAVVEDAELPLIAYPRDG